MAYKLRSQRSNPQVWIETSEEQEMARLAKLSQRSNPQVWIETRHGERGMSKVEIA